MLCIPTPLFNSFCCISQPPFIKSPVYSGPKSSCFAKDQLYTRFFNYSSFVNPLLHLIYLVMVFIYVKLKKAWSLVMQLLIRYLLNGYQENYDSYRKREWRWLETVCVCKKCVCKKYLLGGSYGFLFLQLVVFPCLVAVSVSLQLHLLQLTSKAYLSFTYVQLPTN